MGPIDYTAQFANPATSIFDGMATGLNMQGAQQGLAMNEAAEARARELHPLAMAGAAQNMELAANQDQRAGVQLGINQDANARAQGNYEAQQQEAAAQAARQQAFQSAMGNLATLGPNATIDDYMAVANQFPEHGAALRETWDTLDDSRKEGTAQVLGQVALAFKSGNPERAIALAEEYAAAAENTGDTQGARTAQMIVETAKANPDAALATVGLALAQLDPDVAEMAIGGGDDGVQSSEIIGGRVTVQNMRSGDVRVIDNATQEVLTGDAAIQAIEAAEAAVGEAERLKTLGRGTGSDQADIATGGEAAATIKASEMGLDLGLKAFDALSNIRSNIGNIDKAVAALDAGARTGNIESRVPTWNAATLELRNLQSQLGLDIIGSVTFGALSKGELDLALNTALPTTMSEPDLRAWLIEKRAAQEKLAGYMDEQARFLSRPGNTLSMWLDRVDEQAATAQPVTQTETLQPVAPGGPAPSVAVGDVRESSIWKFAN